MNKLIRFILALVAPLAITQGAMAADYTVAKGSCVGTPGDLKWAVDKANTDGAPSTITFAAGVTVDYSTCNDLLELKFDGLKITEDATIIGNFVPPSNRLSNVDVVSTPATIDGNFKYATPDGFINPPDCPQEPPDSIFNPTYGLFTIADGAKVEIKNVKLQGFPWLFVVESNATLEVKDSVFWKIQNFVKNCTGSPIIIKSGGTFRAENVLMTEFFRAKEGSTAGTIENTGGNVELVDVDLRAAPYDNAIYSNGGTVNIVSSTLDLAGGLRALNGAKINVTNSIWSPRSTNHEVWELIRADGADSVISFEASTLRIESYACRFDNCDDNGSGLAGLITASNGGNIEMKSTVVGGGSPTTAVAKTITTYGDTGSFSVDVQTYVVASLAQDAPELCALGVRWSSSAFNCGVQVTLTSGIPLGSSTFYPEDVTLEAGSALIDLVDNTTAPLLSPIDSTPITTDAFGNPRTDGNLRDAGAVQVGNFTSGAYATHLVVAGIGNGEVTLSWNRPKDPAPNAVAGYTVKYCLDGTMPCDTFQETISDPATLTTTVTGLTNGSTYQFQITPFDNQSPAVDGPPSNIVKAKPLGALGQVQNLTASPGDAEVRLKWLEPTDLGGQTIASYVILFRPSGTTNWKSFGSVPPSQKGVTVNLLTNGTEYEFEVSALSGGGEKGASAIATATPQGGDTGTGGVNRSPTEEARTTPQSNNPRYWEHRGYGSCTKYSVSSDYGSVWTLSEPASALILKSGQTNYIWENPGAGDYGTPSGNDISHVITCRT